MSIKLNKRNAAPVAAPVVAPVVAPVAAPDLPKVDAIVLQRFHKNLVASGAAVKKNRGIIAAVAADLPVIMAGVDKEGATARRRDAYQHIIAGCVGVTVEAVIAAWPNQKTWDADWQSAYGNARSIVSQAMVLAGLATKKETKPNAGQGKAKDSGAGEGGVSPEVAAQVVKSAPVADLVEAVTLLPPSTAVSGIISAARKMSDKAMSIADRHFIEAILIAASKRQDELDTPATPCK